MADYFRRLQRFQTLCGPRTFACLVLTSILLFFVTWGHRTTLLQSIMYSNKSDWNVTSRWEVRVVTASQIVDSTTTRPHTTGKIVPPVQKNTVHSLCVLFVGGLGNQMFEYAAVAGIAHKKNMSVFIDAKSTISKTFGNLTAAKKDDMSECRKFQFVRENRDCSFSENLLQITNTKNYRLGNYLQSWKYFRGVDSHIRKQFVFNTDIQNKANAYFKKHLERNKISDPSKVTFVGVHVRRGDITNVQQFVKYGYLVPDKNYFLEAFNIMRRMFGNVLFIVSSNGMEWVKNNIVVNNVTLIEDKNSAEVDLAILTMCNHTILSVGSYGWWAGYLTNGLAIFYRYPAKEGSNLRKQFSRELYDYFYPGWIGLE